MSLDDAIERLGAGKETYNRWVGVYIGVLAVLLAICNVGGANATKDATHSNIAAANTWAFFQAKNIRRNSIGLAADDLELMLAAMPAMPEEAKRKFEDKIKAYREQYRSLTTDPQKQEGLDELFVKGKLLETGARRGAAQGPLLRLESGAAADRHRAGVGLPDRRQCRTSGPQRRPRRPGHAADAQRLHFGAAPAVPWLRAGTLDLHGDHRRVQKNRPGAVASSGADTSYGDQYRQGRDDTLQL